jgi:cholesterol oxidase
MKRLSSPIGQMLSHYSVVVVGSGYGGAITAARVARAGRDVCVLERGRELHPGEYPDSALKAARHLQVHTPTAHYGSGSALFDVHAGHDITVLVGCGLGGTSLINANVALKPGDSVFTDKHWPDPLRQPGTLEPYMRLAREMLGSNPYPEDWPKLPKLAALDRAAGHLGTKVDRPCINVSFTDGPNRVGVHQAACNLCGDCCSGCNTGAKNTVLMNYLPDAHAHGAHIFTEVAVRSVQRDNGRWRVAFQVHSGGRRRYRSAPSQFITADVVVLAAGALGSTEILLRSKALGLPVSDRLGQRFSGNGDVLAFAYDTDRSVRGVGLGKRTPRTDTTVGPTIAGLIDLRNEHADLTKALIIEDGAIPGALASVLPAAMYAASFGRPNRKNGSAARRLRELALISLGAYRGPVDRTLTYLIMSTDNSGGRIVLEGDRIHVDWPEVAEQPVFARDNRIADIATNALRGTAVPDPLWAWTRGRSLITVHPLGGCVMGVDQASGVVDHKGRVFDSTGGGVHPGLYVADGSVVPQALDVNPLLTISALAERTAEMMIADRKWANRPRASLAAVPSAKVATRTASLSFTERLSGFVSLRVDINDFREAFERGRDGGALIELRLTIDYPDVQAMLHAPSREASISGTMLAPELSPHRLTVTDGSFSLLDQDPSQAETWRMRYRMNLVAEDTKRYTFDGYKVIRRHGARHAWADTSTLYATISELDGPKLGIGILHLRPVDFGRLLRTIEVKGVPIPQRSKYRRAFMTLFAGEMVRIYGGPLDEAGAFATATKALPARPERPDEIWWCDGQDRWHSDDELGKDAFLRLTRYNKAGEKGPVMLASGFAMSAHSFVTPTIDKNLTEFLTDHGYDVWLFDYRAGIDLPSALTQFTIDDIARKDWPLAVKQVLEVTGRDDVKVFGHCVGSVSLQMAILAGLEGVRSAVCGQFSLHPATSVLNWAKAEFHVSNALRDLGVKILAPGEQFTVPGAVLDVLFRALPMPAEERCGQAVCRWINAIYGCTHRHAQLNEATHRGLATMFGVGNMDSLNHLTLMLRRSLAVTSSGGSGYLQHPERMAATKVLLLQGRDNYIFHPAGTLRTLRWLRSHNPTGHYRRIVLPGYGHLDTVIGARASTDVYPGIVGFLDQT